MNSLQPSAAATMPPTTTVSTEFSGHAYEQATTTQARRGGRQFVNPQSAETAVVVEPAGDTGHDCPALDGECVSHEDDHGVTIHFGPERRASAAGLADVLTHRLVKWDNDAEPTVSIGEEDLDLDGTTQLIEVVEKQLANLRAARQHLAAAIQQHRGAAEELAAFISQHDGQLLTRPPEKGFYSWAARVNGRLTVVVPEDHDPVLTLRLVREQVARTGEAK